MFTPEAQDQLAALYGYIADAASPESAERYINAIVTHCEGLQTFPNRGTCRDDIRPGLRITNYKKRTVIAFAVDVEMVTIVGIYYGGRNYEADLQFDL
ncbi:MAG: type II toxin-antitoxin system RelE/ParE family toxin [Gallionellaceae bacterium]|nr:MAG: type II toxin-antitoxin system RelE/ParE family toxin [Gallionellaceae bacterium]